MIRSACSIASPRRHIWLWPLLLTILLFLVIRTLPPGPPGSSLSWSSIKILRPGDCTGCNREWKPSDDNFPPAHEPIGLGTLRDVREERFYAGGTSTIEPFDNSPLPELAIYDPYPEYNSREWSQKWKGRFRACQGPRGTLSRRRAEDMVLAYPGVQKDFPFPKIGSYEALGLDGYSCTTRHSRFGAVGYENSMDEVVWENVNWKALQTQCLERNSDRYSSADSPSAGVLPLHPPAPAQIPPSPNEDTTPSFQPRTAVVLRAWHDMEWTENMKQHVRSLIMELSLHSGAEYEVLLLTHVKDNDIPLYGPDQDQTIQILKKKYIPKEFWDITVFFNEKTLESWYPKVPEHKPIHQHLQPLQAFSLTNPSFAYIWQLEMDARFTGHTYHFLTRAASFAKHQPRKYLWERNAHYYIPGTHGPWTEFTDMVGSAMQGKERERERERESVWGPQPPAALPWLNPIGPNPPVKSPEEDQYEWGVGEEADLIEFLPIFDPSETKWVFTDMLWNVPSDSKISRRASPVAMGRFSHTLLSTIHAAQVTHGLALVSEMTASTFSLWHGLKAVSIPHPIYTDGKWVPKELNTILNRGPSHKMNSGPDSIWNWDHAFDHILYRLGYMFTGQSGEDFYRRWLGFVPDKGQFTDGSFHQDPQGRNWFDNGDLREDLYGELCFPSMLLHPIKNTELVKGRDMAVPV